MTKEEFINTNTFISASSITLDTATFNNVNTIDLSADYTTNASNSLFFINGIHIYSQIILAIQNSGNNMNVMFDTGSLGYPLESIDGITAQGKFKIL